VATVCRRIPDAVCACDAAEKDGHPAIHPATTAIGDLSIAPGILALAAVEWAPSAFRVAWKARSDHRYPMNTMTERGSRELCPELITSPAHTWQQSRLRNTRPLDGNGSSFVLRRSMAFRAAYGDIDARPRLVADPRSHLGRED
jgi:hypothetical protein